ncbi:MAG: hypothetical protein JXR49_11660 [Acidobacteria bacterium]|nr:hypothetical protein [Acidobacteriota bacterium]
MPDEFDGRVLDPNGVEIDLPYRVFKRLKKLHLLERDRITGKRRIRKQAFEALTAGDLFSHPQGRNDGPSLNSDWRAVYRQECRNPGYVIENGRPPARSGGRLRRRNLP